MNKIRVSSIQRGCVYDGPGVRTTVFLKGCTLHCPWCCNPENISSEQEYFIDDKKCLKFKGINSALCTSCERNQGGKSILECPFGIARPVSQMMDASDLVFEIEKDKDLYATNGGVTFSGGEPLLQSECLLPVLRDCKELNIGIAFETTLYVAERLLKEVLPYANIMIVDLKLQPEQGNIPNYFNCISRNITLVKAKEIEIFYRLVFVNSMLGVKEKIYHSLKTLGVDKIELLKCHHLGSKKYEKLHLKSEDFTADEGEFQEFSEYLLSQTINVSQLKI